MTETKLIPTEPAASLEGAPDAPSRVTHRDTETGQYVTAEHAAANPATTVREDDSRVRELQRRLNAVVTLHQPASDEMSYCLGCDEESDVFNTEWPCPTYRAALGVES